MVNGGIGSDAFTLGPSMDDLGPLTFNGNGGNDSLTIDDTQGTGLPAYLRNGVTGVHCIVSYAVTGQDVSRASSYIHQTFDGTIPGTTYADIAYTGIADLELDGSNAGAAYSIPDASAPTIVNGGSGHNTFTAGPSLDAIGLLTINGNGNDLLTIDDTQGTGLPANLPVNISNVHAIISYGVTGGDVGRTATYSYTSNDGGAVGGGTVDEDIVYTGIANLQLNGSNVGAGYSITGNSVYTYINGGSGHNAFTVGPSLDSVRRWMIINGNVDNDSLTIDDSQGTGIPTGLPDGSSNLQISMYYIVTGQDVGRYTNYFYDTADGGSSSASAAEIQYTDIASLELDGSNFSAPITVAGTSIPTTVSAGSGSSVIVGNAGSAQGILGPLSIDSHVETQIPVTIDDSADPVARTATLASFAPAGAVGWEAVRGVTPADIYVPLSNAADMKITSGAGQGHLAADLSTGAGLTVSSGKFVVADDNVLASGCNLTVGDSEAFNSTLPSLAVSLTEASRAAYSPAIAPALPVVAHVAPAAVRDAAAASTHSSAGRRRSHQLPCATQFSPRPSRLPIRLRPKPTPGDAYPCGHGSGQSEVLGSHRTRRRRPTPLLPPSMQSLPVMDVDVTALTYRQGVSHEGDSLPGLSHGRGLRLGGLLQLNA